MIKHKRSPSPHKHKKEIQLYLCPTLPLLDYRTNLLVDEDILNISSDEEEQEDMNDKYRKEGIKLDMNNKTENTKLEQTSFLPFEEVLYKDEMKSRKRIYDMTTNDEKLFNSYKNNSNNNQACERRCSVKKKLNNTNCGRCPNSGRADGSIDRNNPVASDIERVLPNENIGFNRDGMAGINEAPSPNIDGIVTPNFRASGGVPKGGVPKGAIATGGIGTGGGSIDGVVHKKSAQIGPFPNHGFRPIRSALPNADDSERIDDLGKTNKDNALGGIRGQNGSSKIRSKTNSKHNSSHKKRSEDAIKQSSIFDGKEKNSFISEKAPTLFSSSKHSDRSNGKNFNKGLFNLPSKTPSEEEDHDLLQHILSPECQMKLLEKGMFELDILIDQLRNFRMNCSEFCEWLDDCTGNVEDFESLYNFTDHLFDVAIINAIMKLKDSRRIRLFLSSPFGGMEIEREEFFRLHLPKIRSLCEKNGFEFTYVDMRWGITTEMAKLNRTVDICLNSISLSDIFVGFFGQRYGWYGENDMALQAAIDVASERNPWLRDYRDRSVTELEFLHGFLRNIEMNLEIIPTIIGFRSENYDAKVYSSTTNEKTKKKHIVESDEAKAKLKKLKENCSSHQDKMLKYIPEYQNPFEGATLIFEQLLNFLEEQLPILSENLLSSAIISTSLFGKHNKQLSLFVKEFNELKFSELKFRKNFSNFFIEFDFLRKLKEYVLQYLFNDQDELLPITCISQQPGYGKTAFLNNLLQKLECNGFNDWKPNKNINGLYVNANRLILLIPIFITSECHNEDRRTFAKNLIIYLRFLVLQFSIRNSKNLEEIIEKLLIDEDLEEIFFDRLELMINRLLESLNQMDENLDIRLLVDGIDHLNLQLNSNSISFLLHLTKYRLKIVLLTTNDVRDRIKEKEVFIRKTIGIINDKPLPLVSYTLGMNKQFSIQAENEVIDVKKEFLMELIDMEIMERNDRQLFIEKYLIENRSKTLLPEQMKQLVDCTNNKSIFYLLLLIDEICAVGHYRQLDKKISLLRKLKFPYEIIIEKFQRWENEFNPDTNLVKEIIVIIYCYGTFITPKDIYYYLNESVKSVGLEYEQFDTFWSSLRYGMEDIFMFRDSLVHVSSQHTIDAVRHYYLDQNEELDRRIKLFSINVLWKSDISKWLNFDINHFNAAMIQLKWLYDNGLMKNCPISPVNEYIFKNLNKDVIVSIVKKLNLNYIELFTIFFYYNFLTHAIYNYNMKLSEILYIISDLYKKYTTMEQKENLQNLSTYVYVCSCITYRQIFDRKISHIIDQPIFVDIQFISLVFKFHLKDYNMKEFNINYIVEKIKTIYRFYKSMDKPPDNIQYVQELLFTTMLKMTEIWRDVYHHFNSEHLVILKDLYKFYKTNFTGPDTLKINLTLLDIEDLTYKEEYEEVKCMCQRILEKEYFSIVNCRNEKNLDDLIISKFDITMKESKIVEETYSKYYQNTLMSVTTKIEPLVLLLSYLSMAYRHLDDLNEALEISNLLLQLIYRINPSFDMAHYYGLILNHSLLLIRKGDLTSATLILQHLKDHVEYLSNDQAKLKMEILSALSRSYSRADDRISACIYAKKALDLAVNLYGEERKQSLGLTENYLQTLTVNEDMEVKYLEHIKRINRLGINGIYEGETNLFWNRSSISLHESMINFYAFHLESTHYLDICYSMLISNNLDPLYWSNILKQPKRRPPESFIDSHELPFCVETNIYRFLKLDMLKEAKYLTKKQINIIYTHALFNKELSAEQINSNRKHFSPFIIQHFLFSNDLEKSEFFVKIFVEYYSDSREGYLSVNFIISCVIYTNLDLPLALLEMFMFYVISKKFSTEQVKFFQKLFADDIISNPNVKIIIGLINYFDGNLSVAGTNLQFATSFLSMDVIQMHIFIKSFKCILQSFEDKNYVDLYSFEKCDIMDEEFIIHNILMHPYTDYDKYILLRIKEEKFIKFILYQIGGSLIKFYTSLTDENKEQCFVMKKLCRQEDLMVVIDTMKKWNESSSQNESE
ncbi:hypothetical protein SNEBB_010445 [Seison nebaliae]|nr:hypothetical protein SNEBB_010445 [Seison nebaliae]